MYSEAEEVFGAASWSVSSTNVDALSAAMYEDVDDMAVHNDHSLAPPPPRYEPFDHYEDGAVTNLQIRKDLEEDKEDEEAPLPELPLELKARDWNEEWQQVVLCSALTPEERQEKQQKLTVIAREFAAAAAPVARLIAEQSRRKEKRLNSVDAGGIAGGVKFVHNGIFYKQAVSHAIYADEGAARKAAGRELLALRAVLACNVVGLQV